MGNRRYVRVQAIIPVRMFGMDAENKPFSRVAHTVDVSSGGARIGGVTVRLKVGDTIGLQYGTEKSRFKVVWTGQQATSGQLGLESLEPHKQIWKIALPGPAVDVYDPDGPSRERRSNPRYCCHIGVEMRTDPNQAPTHVVCTDISVSGCYLETWSPLPLGRTAFLVFKLPAGLFCAVALVCTSHAGFGMGLRFTEVKGIDQLHSLIAGLSVSDPGGAWSGVADEDDTRPMRNGLY